MTGTKGPSNLYGNKNQKPTEHISYPYAKSFNNSTLYDHFSRHGKEFGANSITDYENKAIYFANKISTVADSFVDRNNSTYKYNYVTNTLVIINSKGKIISYFKPKSGKSYYEKQKEMKVRK